MREKTFELDSAMFFGFTKSSITIGIVTLTMKKGNLTDNLILLLTLCQLYAIVGTHGGTTMILSILSVLAQMAVGLVMFSYICVIMPWQAMVGINIALIVIYLGFNIKHILPKGDSKEWARYWNDPVRDANVLALLIFTIATAVNIYTKQGGGLLFYALSEFFFLCGRHSAWKAEGLNNKHITCTILGTAVADAALSTIFDQKKTLQL